MNLKKAIEEVVSGYLNDADHGHIEISPCVLKTILSELSRSVYKTGFINRYILAYLALSDGEVVSASISRASYIVPESVRLLCTMYDQRPKCKVTIEESFIRDAKAILIRGGLRQLSPNQVRWLRSKYV